jgi:Glycosyl transferase family 2
MRIVMTLCVKDEEDILDAQLAFHLRAGVDFVIATDTGSTDGSVEILESYRAAGLVHLLRDDSRTFRHSVVSTRMARLAASRFAADWVINSDADEFWYPRGPDLKKVLEAVPPRYGVVRCVWRPFVPRPHGSDSFHDRMTIRLVAPEPINDPTSPYRPNVKVVHRGNPDVRLAGGNHDLVGSSLIPLRGWSPIEVLHFPVRSPGQMAKKYESSARYGGVAKAAFTRRFSGAGSGAAFDRLVVSDEQVESGLAGGLLAVDTRLRSALASLSTREGGGYALPLECRLMLELDAPSLADDASYAQEIAALGDADLVRIQRRMDALEQRLAGRAAQHRAKIVRAVMRVRRGLYPGNRS